MRIKEDESTYVSLRKANERVEYTRYFFNPKA